MAKESISVTPKKRGRGRPATGQDPTLTVRLPIDLRSAIETWAKQQKDRPSRSEAIRRLIEIALATKPRNRSREKQHLLDQA
jgi:Arc/MetJ-type ribon-helix-helix transcriptional regulator